VAESQEVFLLNDRYFLLETYVPNQDAFDKPHKHLFEISVFRDLSKLHKENQDTIKEIYIQCKICEFTRIFSLKTREKIFKEIFLKTFDKKYERAKKSNKVVSWEYISYLCKTSVLCVAVGHDYERLENYVDEKGYEIYLECVDDWTGIRLESIMWHCLICHHRTIEVYPDNKNYFKRFEGT